MPFDFDKIAEDAEGQGIFPEDSGIGKAMLFEAAKREPDQFASDVTLAEKTGLSPTVVETDRQRATRASLFKDLDIDYIKKTNPALYNKIRSPEDAPIIQDDISALAELGNYILGVGDGFTRGNELITLSKKGQNLYDDPENVQIRRELKDGFESLSPSREIKDLGSFALAIPEMTAEQIPIQGELYLPNSFGEYLTSVAYPMMFLGPQVIDRAFHLERNLHFSESMIQEDAQGRGIDTTEAKIAANSYASVATVFEAVPQLKFGKILGGKAIAKSIAKSATAKAMARPTVRRLIKDKGKDILGGFVSEGITEFSQSVAESLFRNEAIRSSDTSLKAADAETIIADAIQEGLAGAAGGGGFSIISAVPSSAIEFRDIQKAKQYEGRLQALKEKVTETKTFKRRKEVLESYINEHTEGEEIALDARAVAQYFQDIDPNGKEGSAIIKELGIEEAFVDALSRGDDVHVPLGTFMKLADNKHFDSLVQETRDSATGMTPRESVVAEANLENKMVAEAEQLLAENDALSEVVQSANEVESNIRSQLESSGRFTPDVVDRYTALHKAFAVTTAARTGQLPADIYNNMGLTISDEVTQGGVQFEQAAPTKVDTLTDAPADSVVETSADEVLKYETDVPRLSPERMVELTKSVQERGIVGELPVIREGGKLTLEDGHHLARVAQSLGIPVPVRIYEGDTLDNRSKILEAADTRSKTFAQEANFPFNVNADGTVTLTHYSKVPDLQTLDPAFYGSGIQGAEASRKVKDAPVWQDRTYFGLGVGEPGGYKKEPGLGATKYSVRVPLEELYDMAGDPDNLKATVAADPDATSGFVNQIYTPAKYSSSTLYEKAIRDQGYVGYYMVESGAGAVAAVFEATTPETVQNAQAAVYGQPTFFSGLEKAAEALKQEKGPGQQMLNTLKKQPGVKQEEIEWLGLEEYLAGKDTITKQEIVDFIQQNGVKVEEVQKNEEGVSDDEYNGPYLDEVDGVYTVYAADESVIEEGLTETDAELRLQSAVEEWELSDDVGPVTTKFQDYQLPGGENYQEILLTLPTEDKILEQWQVIRPDGVSDGFWASEEQANARAEKIRGTVVEGTHKDIETGFRSAHFDELNILAHTRFNERTDSDGNKVLFIEEIQSDWHQTGRSKGYADPAAAEAKRAELFEKQKETRLAHEKARDDLDAFTDGKSAEVEADNLSLYQLLDRYGKRELHDNWRNLGEQQSKLRHEMVRLDSVSRSKVPDAPFKKTWPQLAMKRMIRYAVDNGFDKVAWTTGEQQADRYNLSKQLEKVTAFRKEPNQFQIMGIDKQGNSHDFGVHDADKLDGVVGKLLADKIRAQETPNGAYAGNDLKVGGEGMKAFYDDILVKNTNKYIKKFGAKVEATKVNISGGKPTDYADFDAYVAAQKDTVGVHGFDVTEKMKEAALQGQTLFQAKRGSITVFDDKATIRLFEAADLSTFLHESGHFFLEQMTLLAPRAPEIQKDLDLIMKWMGVSHPSDIQTEQHEKFARGFEAYLREGKAPSAELETAFSRFRAWLVHIYRSTAKLRVELNDDIRGVFDRMLASDNAINEQKNRPDEKLLYESAEEAGMTPEEFKAYTEAKQMARDAAKRDLTHETMRELNRQRTEAWKEEVKELTAETQDELGQLPAYKAKSFLATGKFPDGTEPGIDPMKLSRAGVIETSGKELLGKLPFGKNTVWVKEGGVHPDAAAPLLGFSSGDEMVKAMVAAPNFNTAVKESVQNEMKRRHGDLLNEPERLREEAEAALANDEKATAIKIELQSLEKQSRRSLTPKQALRNAARRIIAETPVGEVTPGKYLATSLRQARAALEHVANGEYGQASTAKRNQLLNHFLYMEARDAVKEIESTQRYMTKFDRPGVRKNIEQVHLDQIDSALEAYDFKRSVTQKELQKRKSLARYIEEQEALGNQVIVSKDLVDATNTKHYKNMSLEELRGLKDAIKNMEHLGRLKSKLLDNQRHRDFEEWKGEAIGSMFENNKVHPVAPEFGKGFVTKAKKGAKYVHAELLNMEFVLKKLDGDKLGVMHNTVFQPLSDAQDEAIERRNSAAEYFKPLFKKLKREWGWSPKVHVPEVGQSFHREELVSIALNWGNEGNRQRIRDGYNWSDAKVGAILDNLTKEEWGFIQGTWDYLDTVLWPEVQALEKELTGVAPEKVPATKIKTKHGTMRGGYYPLRYDSDFSERQVRFDEKATVQDIFGGNWAKAQTKKGHVEARVEELKRPVKLDLGVLSEHLTNVIQDLTHRKPIMDVYRFLKDEEVASTIKSTAGLETYRQMIPWLRDIAGGFRMPAAGSLGRILMHARTGTSIVGIGLSVTTALINLTGIFPALAEVSADRLIKGVTRTAFKPVETWEFISERSSMMNHRSQVFDREASEQIRKQFQKKGSIVPLATWYMLIAKVDQVVTMSTWMGAYEKGMADSENHEKSAIEYADHVVRTTQSSGRPIDLSSFQRGSEFQKLFTVFYSYFNMVYNQLGRNVSNLKNQGAGYFPRFMGNLVAVVLLPALLGELLAGRGPDEEDDESWAQWSSRNLVSYTTGTVPLLRDMSGPMYRSLIDRDAPYYPYKLTPVAGAIQSIINIGSQFGAEDPDTKKQTKAVIDAAGYWLHLPARQTWKTTEHVWDSVTGEREFNPWHMLAGQPREE